MWNSRHIWITRRANWCMSATLLLFWRIDSTFWLSEYQITLTPEKWLAKASKARQTALSSLHVELWARSTGDRFWWNTKFEFFTKAPQAELDASEKVTLTGRDWTDQQTLLLRNTTFFFQKLISERESSGRKTSLSQERAEFTTEKKNLVIIRATEPTQGERDIIWPVTLATLFTCTFWGGWQDNSSTRPAFNFSMCSSVAL